MITRRGFMKLAATGWLAALSVAAWATGVEAMGRPRIERLALTPPRWTPGLKLKVVAIADFHACQPWMSPERIGEICDQANALGGDIILLLGDYATSMKFVTSYVPNRETAEVLARLKAPLGVHAILGNHDYWQDEAYQADPSRKPDMQAALEAVGIPVYINQAVRLEKDGMPFWLAGLGDQIAVRRPRPSGGIAVLGIEDIDGTLAAVTDDAPVLMMAHEPYAFDRMPDRLSLVLSGHTHGGQIKIFGWAPFVLNTPDQRYLVGHMVQDGRHLFVSRGLGCSGIPLRLGAWPEIVMMEIG
jgi:predicted MPP superfamily phosphohydrolase